MARGDHVERQAHQFEPEIKRDQIGGRDQHQHAKRRKHDQNRIFEALLMFAQRVIERHGNGGSRADQRQDFEKPGEIVDNETAAEGDQLALRQQQYDCAGDHQKSDRGAVNRARRRVDAEHAEHQQRHGAEAKHDFRENRQERGQFSRRSSTHFPNAAACTARNRVLIIVDQLHH